NSCNNAILILQNIPIIAFAHCFMNSIYSPTRLLLVLTCTATLTACVAYAPHSNRSDDPLVATQEETSHIPNFGQVAIQHTQSGRLRLMIPEQRVSFYLDP